MHVSQDRLWMESSPVRPCTFCSDPCEWRSFHSRILNHMIGCRAANIQLTTWLFASSFHFNLNCCVVMYFVIIYPLHYRSLVTLLQQLKRQRRHWQLVTLLIASRPEGIGKMRKCGMCNAESKMQNAKCGMHVIGYQVKPHDLAHSAIYHFTSCNAWQ